MFNLLYEKRFDECLLAISSHKGFIYTGGTNKTLYRLTFDFLKMEEVAFFEKSVRSITSYDDFVGCASYDGTAVVLKNHEFFDKIEGPETEIKSIRFSENECSLSTRGKQVWVLKISNEIEVESILEDHNQDVKGVSYIGDRLLSFGYDRTIKVYERAMYGDEKYELVESVDGHYGTIWDVVQYESGFFCCDHEGFIYKYENLNEYFVLKHKIRGSKYPIFCMKQINDRIFAYISNKININIIDSEFELIFTIENVSQNEINSFCYDVDNKMIFTVDDSGILKVFELKV